MASQASLTIRRANAFDRLRRAGARVAKHFELDAPDLSGHKDPEVGRIRMVENIADFLESLDKAAKKDEAKSEAPPPPAPLTVTRTAAADTSSAPTTEAVTFTEEEPRAQPSKVVSTPRQEREEKPRHGRNSRRSSR